MKFLALSALAATASALDFVGCPGANWGDEKAMRRESDCIFHKLGPHDGELNKPTLTKALYDYCEWRENDTHKSLCHTLARQYEFDLVSRFGSHGELDEEQFWHVYYYIKKRMDSAETDLSGDVYHKVSPDGYGCVQLVGARMESSAFRHVLEKSLKGLKPGSCASIGFDHRYKSWHEEVMGVKLTMWMKY